MLVSMSSGQAFWTWSLSRGMRSTIFSRINLQRTRKPPFSD